MKNTKFVFTLSRYDGKTVVHVAETLGEFLAMRESVEESLGTTWNDYTVTFPKASAVYRDTNALVNRVASRTVSRLLDGGDLDKA